MVRRMPPEIKEEIEAKGGLDSIIAKLPSQEKIDAMAKVHHALSDRTRLQILFFLYNQESCVCLLHEVTGLAYSKLSYHLKILRDAGLIEARKQGNYMIYDITDKGIKYMEICLDQK